MPAQGACAMAQFAHHIQHVVSRAAIYLQLSQQALRYEAFPKRRVEPSL